MVQVVVITCERTAFTGYNSLAELHACDTEFLILTNLLVLLALLIYHHLAYKCLVRRLHLRHLPADTVLILLFDFYFVYLVLNQLLRSNQRR